MRGILELLARFSGLFLFLFLELICFLLIIRFNDKQQRIWLSSSSRFVGSLNESYDGVADYFSLNDRVEELTQQVKGLREENIVLLNQLKETELKLISEQEAQRFDTSLSFNLIPAQIISKSIVGLNNTITLDRGTLDGVYPHMGVINGEGVIGIVREASDHFALVMLLQHQQTNISAAIKRSQYFGPLIWNNPNPSIMNLEAITKNVQVKAQDTIITSGYSNIFPRGLPIGRVESCEIKDGSDVWKIEVKLNHDIAQIQHVYVVKNQRESELLELQQESE